MRRRELLPALAAAAVAAARGVGAQPAMPVAGFLSGRSRAETGSLLADFHRGLAEAGFPDGERVRIEYRWADGHYERLPALAAELVERRVAVSRLPAETSRRSRPKRRRRASRSSSSQAAIRSAPGSSRAWPARRQRHWHFAFHRRARPKEARVPARARSIAILVNPRNPASTAEAADVRTRSRASGVELQVVQAAGEDDLAPAFATMASRGIDGLFVANDRSSSMPAAASPAWRPSARSRRSLSRASSSRRAG